MIDHPNAQRQNRPTALGWIAATAFCGLVVTGAAAAVFALHARKAEALIDAPEPLPIAAERIEREFSYETIERFAGRVEPARETLLAFERGGLLVNVGVEEGDVVKPGAVIAKLDTAPLKIRLDQLDAERRVTEADLDLARATLARREELKRKGHDSAQSFDDARFRVAALTARIAEIDARAAMLELDLEKSELRAPFSGVIGPRLLDEGAVVAAGSALASLQEVSRPRARIGAPPRVAADMEVGGIHKITVAGQTVRARLISIASTLNPSTRTVALLFKLAPDGGVPMGEIARVDVIRTLDAPGAWVPLSALREGRKGLWTLFVVDDGAIATEDVAVVHVTGSSAFVAGGFPDGAIYAVDGLERLVPGQRVEPIVRELVAGG